MYKRYLKMDLPTGQSAFLWGARKTGKSTYLHEHFPASTYYDLLKSDLFLRFAREPHLFREEIISLSDEEIYNRPIIIDEVQRIPMLLNEIHWLIENRKAYFILCGSSARKLRQIGVNMLGGRAWRFQFFPLAFPEITDFDLLKTLRFGTIPAHYISSQPEKSLQAYVEDYLTQEIKAEGLVRDLPDFARFLDAIGFSHGEMINHTNIARDVGVSAYTVKEYFQILVDTLLGYYVFPFKKHVKRDIISSVPKFYLFDIGVANFLGKKAIVSLKGPEAGRALEHFIFLELVAYRAYAEKRFDINYWRTKTGLEVDFIVDGLPIEVKISETVRDTELKGLRAFCEEHQPKQAYVVSLDPRPRRISNQILILPCEEFLRRLWAGEIIA